MKYCFNVLAICCIVLASSCVDETIGKWELRVQNLFQEDLGVYVTKDIQTDPFTFLGTVKSGETVNEMGYFDYGTTYVLQGRDSTGQLFDEFVIVSKDETVGEFCLWVMEP